MEQRTVSRQRPKSSSSPQPSRKIFNCIVEDRALVAGAKASTRNGLRQWVKNGSIRLFVPLHALEHLNLLKNTPGEHERIIDDIQETLAWLDEATTKYPNFIILQGGDETFEEWADVKKFAVPRSLFSEQDSDHEDVQSAESTTTVSPSKADSSPTNGSSLQSLDDCTSRRTARQGAPETLQPLFNYIIWRIHQEQDPVAAMESFIFLCNDPWKTDCIRDFGVRCKTLEQLRDAIAREDREHKVQHRSTPSTSKTADLTATPSSPTHPRSPPTAPAAMLKSQTNVLDPDAFDRSISLSSPTSPRFGRAVKHQSQRSRGGNARGRGRGMDVSKPAFVDMLYAAGQSMVDSTADGGPEIDPNSFERPRGGHTGRGGRKLWTPG